MTVVPGKIIIENIGYVLNRNPNSLDLDLSFPQHGGNSLSALALAGLCKRQGVLIPIGAILRSQSLNELLSASTFIEDPWPLESLDKLPETECQRLFDEYCPVAMTGIDPGSDIASTLPTPNNRCLVDDKYALGLASNSLRGEEAFIENPTSHLQSLMIRDSIKEFGTNIVRYYETYKPEDISTIKAAWNTLFTQEAILRLSYSEDLKPQNNSHFDWTEVTTKDPVQFDGWVHAPITRSGIRATWKVITLSSLDGSQCDIKSTVIWTVHHALIDGYSARLLLTKLRSLAAGESVRAGPPYATIVETIQALHHSKRLEGELFWRQQNDLYEKSVVSLQLPPPLDAGSSHGIGECCIPLGAKTQIIQKISQECGVTPAAIFYSAWAVILSVLADNENIIFGTAVLGRNLPLIGIEDVIGPLLSTPPLATSVKGEHTLRKFVLEVFNRMTNLTEYQWTIPKHILRRGFRSALFMGVDFDTLDGNYPIRPIEPPFWKHDSAIPLTVLVNPESTCFQYRKEEFSDDSIHQVCLLFDRTLRSYVRLDMPIRFLQANLVTPETHLTLGRNGNLFSASTRQFSVSDDLITLFERAATEHPEEIAITIGETQLMYSQLDDQVGIVAKALKRVSKKQDIVCVEADRSVSWIISILAILKAGAIYCPLDPELPEEIREFVIRKTSATTLLCKNIDSLSSAMQSGFDNLLGVESILSETASYEGDRFPHRAFPDPSASAYVCFTSGSTGTPKGVTCSHEGLVAFQSDLEVRLFAQPGKRISQMMSPAFDGSIHEIFSALCYGATLVLPAGENIFEALKSADSAIMTPSLAEVLDPSDYPQLENLYLVGEPVKQSTNDRWATATKTYNMYGPTEGTCGATICRLQPGKPITIGRPNPTTRLYILDSKARNVPMGIVGEIHVAGLQVARGYLGMPQATAARFVEDPFCQGTTERMFKTGDRGYWTVEGEIVCLGRNDRHIKLRGYRLDLNDLEIRASRAVVGIKSVAMAVRRDHLVAAIQPSTLDRNVVVAALAKALPGYAQPRDIFLVDKFPTTKVGKLDYKDILSYRSQDSISKDDPLTSLETKIARIWREVLGLNELERITPTSNFLQLGGSSILQMTLLARLSTVLEIRVPLRLIIEGHSLRELATRLESLQQKVDSQTANPNSSWASYKLSPLEQDLWSKYNLYPEVNTKSFNVSSLFYFEPGSLDLVLVEKAWNVALARYTIFKSRYVRIDGPGNGVERHYAEISPCVELVQHANVETEVNRMFDLGKEPPIRVVLTDCELIIVASHIVMDLQALNILFRDVETIYNSGTLSPVEHVYELQNTLTRDEAAYELHFWSQYLRGALPNRDEEVKLSTRNSYDGTSRLYHLSKPLAERILQTARGGDHLTLQQLAIATVALVFEADKEETDIVLGTPFSNRSTDAERETVGLFLQPLPVRVQHSSQSSQNNAKPYLDEIRRSATAALAHAVSWHNLLEYLHIATNYPDNPIFDVMVTFHSPDVAAKLDLPGLIPCFSWADGSKFLLLIEFTALDTGDIVLRVEYDTDNHSAGDIDTLVANITTALWMLLSDLPCSTIKGAIRSGEGRMAMATWKGDLMGRPWTMLQKS
ncbi:hypothetical protein F4825DRAFT_474017 [Nemania diffusa]|nr:hypothetical protein F4825DRAFT_474017 [Nemania diffusa]